MSNRPKRSICWNCNIRSKCKEEKIERQDCKNYRPLVKCERCIWYDGDQQECRNSEHIFEFEHMKPDDKCIYGFWDIDQALAEHEKEEML